MQHAITVAATALLSTLGSALGASEFNIIAQNRQALTGAVVNNTLTGMIDSDEQLAEPFGPGPWQAAVESPAQLGDTTAFAAASQDSLIIPTSLSGSGSVSALLSDTASDTASQGFAVSAFSAFFSIDSPTLVSFSAGISDAGSSSMIFEGQGGIIAELSADAGADLSVDLTALLAPGNYALNAFSGIDLTLAEGASGIGADAFWNLDLTIVPAPSGPALALLAGLVATRRRR